MAAASRISPDEIEKSYDYFGPSFEVSGEVSKAMLGKLIQALQRFGDLPPSFSADRVVMPGVAKIMD
jgi:hypothetical protein